jgi:hypothetical protein
MATKLRPPESPEEPEPELEGLARTGVKRSKSGLSIEERLLGCGSYNALVNDDRMGRRPSTCSLNGDGISEDAAGYFNLKRVRSARCVVDVQSPSQKSLLGLRRGSLTPPRRSYILGVVGENAGDTTYLVESFHRVCRTSYWPQRTSRIMC